MPSIIYVLAKWSPSGNNSSSYGIFWSSFVVQGMNACTPIVTFSLTIERIIYISYPLSYNGRKSRYLTAITVILITVCFGCNVFASFQEFPLKNIEGCLVLACLFVKTGVIFYTYTKTCCGFLNLFAGAVFLIKLRYTGNAIEPLQAPQSANRRINRIALLVMCLELCLNFAPQLTALILFNTLGIVVGSYIGSYNFMGCCFDIFISSSIYSWSLRRSHGTNNNNSFMQRVHAKQLTTTSSH
ncbi:serpentine type 7TM GPCR chemoreceptor srbc domain-containing protein [Ditylenchus destructor]|uniref:Serpentine type 7TM GPCR chemoreceptor srbc domain-containing protein n=1 Tax=Ditylenchus destructor TaxID=166010 RepID=A0AAD4MLQ1_9BILA|nr:serpentine type 7TM GPCR chemoreceptor srbc domain-containing protein [Ditylenchus destructor]